MHPISSAPTRQLRWEFRILHARDQAHPVSRRAAPNRLSFGWRVADLGSATLPTLRRGDGVCRKDFTGRAFSPLLMMARRILFAEDDRTLAEMYTLGLEAEGFLVHVVHDGRAAVRRASLVPPDLALIDLQLPGLDGLRVLKALKADLFSSRIPVVMFSNSDTDGAAAREAQRLGAAGYLLKSATPPRLLAEFLQVRLVPDSSRERQPLPDS